MGCHGGVVFVVFLLGHSGRVLYSGGTVFVQWYPWYTYPSCSIGIVIMNYSISYSTGLLHLNNDYETVGQWPKKAVLDAILSSLLTITSLGIVYVNLYSRLYDYYIWSILRLYTVCERYYID